MIHRIFFDLSVACVFAIMISVLVAAHEFGHYIFARWFGMGVEEFSIGFGKPVILTYFRKKYSLPISSFEANQLTITANTITGSYLDGENRLEHEKRNSGKTLSILDALEGGDSRGSSLASSHSVSIAEKEPGEFMLEETTVFTVRPLPLGGYVRIKGMLPDENGNEINVPGGFYSKTPLARLMVLFAGPLFSVLAGIFILVPIYMISGIVRPSLKPVIGMLVENMPAAKAGIKLNDKIVAINNHPVSNFYQVLKDIRNDGVKPIHVEINRTGKLLNFTIVPELDATPTPVLDSKLNPTSISRIQSKIGLFSYTETKKLSFTGAFKEAVTVPLDTVSGLFSAFTHPAGLKNEVGGPETMVKATAAATQTSLASVFQLAAILSISLGILNLLPIPPLDGGQMLVALTELLRGGKRLSLKVQGIVFTTGLALVGLIMISVIIIDVGRYQFPSKQVQLKPIYGKKVRHN